MVEAVAVPIDTAKGAVVSEAKDLTVIPFNSALTEIENVVEDSTGDAVESVMPSIPLETLTMSAGEVESARRALRITGFQAAAMSTAIGAAVVAAIEAPNAALENILDYKNRRKSAQDPIHDATVSIAVTGVASRAATYVAPYVLSGLANAGITVSIGVLAIPVMVGRRG